MSYPLAREPPRIFRIAAFHSIQKEYGNNTNPPEDKQGLALYIKLYVTDQQLLTIIHDFGNSW